MKKVLTVLVTAMVISVVLVTSLGVTAFAAMDGYGYQEPAPESGDGISNGSGFDYDVGYGPGPAPNSGDGIPDGSGFE
ncbi:MAG: hypothetical protein A2158_00560 [Chloroflexi bacterium RBG_13_46_14]|nr:MAG: hypothetical protein A2158_00560 [Chloroflexi bacterium RBG_13_46_14]